MAAISNYLEDALLNHILRNTAYTTPGAVVYIALYTDDPTDADVGTEVVGGSYARQLCAGTGSWDAPTNGATANTADIIFPQATAAWGIVTHVGIHDHLTAGNLLFHGALTASKQVDDGDTFKFDVGDLDVTLL